MLNEYRAVKSLSVGNTFVTDGTEPVSLSVAASGYVSSRASNCFRNNILFLKIVSVFTQITRTVNISHVFHRSKNKQKWSSRMLHRNEQSNRVFLFSQQPVKTNQLVSINSHRLIAQAQPISVDQRVCLSSKRFLHGVGVEGEKDATQRALNMLLLCYNLINCF